MRWVLLAILFFSLLGCAQKPSAQLEEPKAEPIPNMTQNQTPTTSELCHGNIVQKDECYLSLAEAKADPQLCKRIYAIDKMDECYFLFANSSIQYCDMISSKEMKEACLMQNAIRLKDEKVCQRIQDSQKRTECLSKILPHCLLLNIEERPLCLALEKKDYTECQGGFDCLLAYAKNTSDLRACYAAKEEKERLLCLAIVKNSADECMQAKLESVKDWCALAASKEIGDVEGCQLITKGTSYSNECYQFFAIKMQDSRICLKAAPEEKRDECFVNYAARTKNVSACSRVIESLAKISCYYKAARENGMPSLCNPLETGRLRQECYSLSIFGAVVPQPADCFYVESIEWKDKCFKEAAVRTANKSLCQQILGSEDRKDCESSFE
ncbi:MAG: hypothetical protein N3G80_02345 [Candidatus Micrarchaeota archaeon]|nr:hypothetical protein [Candidatus Micrarchaeota archaeon]